jgi:DNA-binding SARP family transcriptional activator
VLLVHANQVVPLDRLIEELWGEEQPAQASASLQAYVSHLRRALEPGRPARTPPRVLVTQPPGYRLVVAPGDLDAARFVALAEQGHRQLEDGQPGLAVQVLREALGLWRGPALADVADEPFAQAERQRLETLRLDALETGWPPSSPSAGMPLPPPSWRNWSAFIRSGSGCTGC